MLFRSFTCVETPEQNVVAERKHQHLLNVSRALLFQANLPIKFWSDCILTATYTINRIATPLLKNKTPFELLFSKKPNYDHLRTFGCLVFASTLSAHRNKFSPRARTCVFIGYPQGVKGYNLYDINDKQVFISRNTVFHENMFPFHKLNPNSSYLDPFSKLVLPNSITLNDYILHDYPNMHSPAISPSQQQESETSEDQHIDIQTSPVPSDISSQEQLPIVPRRSNRNTKTPAYLRDFECYSAIHDKSSTPHSLSKFVSYDHLSDSYKQFVFAVSSRKQPNNYHEASQHDHWINAMQQELNALTDNNTWTVIELPQNKRAIGCQWVYKIKYNSGGSIERYKSRLVAQGYTQQEGLDFF